MYEAAEKVALGHPDPPHPWMATAKRFGSITRIMTVLAE